MTDVWKSATDLKPLQTTIKLHLDLKHSSSLSELQSFTRELHWLYSKIFLHYIATYVSYFKIPYSIISLCHKKGFSHLSYKKMAVVNSLPSLVRESGGIVYGWWCERITGIPTWRRNAMVKCKLGMAWRHFKNCIFIHGIN